MILTRSYSKRTKACSVNSRQRVLKKTAKTAAEMIEEVIEVLLENSLLEMTPEFYKVASILAVIPTTS